MGLGIKMIDRVPNVQIDERSGMRQITCLMRQGQVGFLGHILRRNDIEPSKRVHAVRVGAWSYRGRGRPSLNYAWYVASFTTDDPESCTRETITSLAQNRKEWGKFVAGLLLFDLISVYHFVFHFVYVTFHNKVAKSANYYYYLLFNNN
jgi:hypothetical protein